MNIKHLTSAAALTALLGGASGAFAQEAAQPAPPPGAPAQHAPAAQIDNATIEKFAKAMDSVQGIQENFTQQLQGVNDSEKAGVLQKQAQEEMVSAVEDAGLTVEEYQNLASMMQQNPKLRERALEKMESIN